MTLSGLCKKEFLEVLVSSYNRIVFQEFDGCYLKGLENFEDIAEKKLRKIAEEYYSSPKSVNQAWRSCKGKLYEFAVFNYIKSVVEENEFFRKHLSVEFGKNQVVIRNWTEIFPDLDIVITEQKTKKVKAILSCKTSLRERLTESAFWRREFEKIGLDSIKVVLVTTDKDNELKGEKNRYILLHVIDCTFITEPRKYQELIEVYRMRYGNRPDFEKLAQKVKPISDISNFLETLLKEGR